MASQDRKEIFERMPVAKALATMAIPTIISQIINLIYNMVDAFYIGRTGNSYMMAATSLILTLTMMNVSFSNLFGVGGGSLLARLMGAKKDDEARNVSAFSVYGAAGLSLLVSLLIGLFMDPVLTFLGASPQTIVYARQYTLYVIVIGSLPTVLSMTLAHLLRNSGNASQASFGLSGGGILNILLDPLFMFVIMPKGQEVAGAAIATLLSNIASCLYLFYAFRKASARAPLSLRFSEALKIGKNAGKLFAVGIPSAFLTGLLDVANISLNKLASAHSDLVLAGMGIVMKVERIPNAVNIGICQGMLPIVAYNYSSGDHERMKKTIHTARISGLFISAISILLLEIFARPVTQLFLSTSAGDQEAALLTIGYAAAFLRIRALASPVQFLNYSTSYTMQAMGQGKATLLHAMVRILVFYIPLMYLLDKLFGEMGLAAGMPAGEACGALFALTLLHFILKKNTKTAH
ncbi:MAG: hypothetical protein IKE21_03140 [Erysipelotrichaceae bacterium]|nr:hypothetical protein [Erysipelotrichaceae bacterium]